MSQRSSGVAGNCGGVRRGVRSGAPAGGHRAGVARPLALLLQLAALLLLAASSATAAPACYRSLSEIEFPHCALVGALALHWAIGGAPGAPPGSAPDRITLGLDFEAPESTTWAAFGVSDGSAMKGADIAVAHRGSDGRWCVCAPPCAAASPFISLCRGSLCFQAF